MCYCEAKVLPDTRVTNKSADHIGISSLIRGIIHEHLVLEGGVNAAGLDRPELVCASRLIAPSGRQKLEILLEGQRLLCKPGQDSPLKKAEMSHNEETDLKNSTKESRSCTTKPPSDSQDILWNPKFIYGSTAPSRPRPAYYRGFTITKLMKINVI
jgi:hypothetical protein